MGELCKSLCPQGQRALRLLIDPTKPQVDRPKLIASLPGHTPQTIGGILDIVIQIVLALLENCDKPDPSPPMPPPRR